MNVRALLLAAGFAVCSLSPRPARAQDRGAAALGDLVRGLGVTTRVLVIAAHPDDEDTQLITWLARGRQVETAYLALTRGDGGQNLIGNELGEGLGAIRSEELLAARRVDGGHQYFTRAFDFGFSKTAEETYLHWPKDSVLGDVVKVVRAFRPHVIVAVFSGTPRDGHGHHQVSGMLAREVYELSADARRFPVAIFGTPWTVSKFYRGAFFNPESRTIRMNVGEYNVLLGRSYSELAGESRSQHKSQGFGVLQRRGVVYDNLRREASRVNEATPAVQEQSIFDGIDTSFARVLGAAPSAVARRALDSLTLATALARRALLLEAPQRAVEPLARVVRLARAARGDLDCPPSGPSSCDAARADLASVLETLESRASRAVAMAAGITVEAIAERELVAADDSVPVGITVYNRGAAPVSVVRATVYTSTAHPFPMTEGGLVVAVDSAGRLGRRVAPPAPSGPWWLRAPRRGDLYAPAVPLVGDADAIGAVATGATPSGIGGVATAEDGRAASRAEVVLRIAEVDVALTVAPVVFRVADPVKGELLRPLTGLPGLAVTLEDALQYVRAGEPIDRVVRVSLRSSWREPRSVTLDVEPPRGLTADSATRVVALQAGEVRDVYVRLRGRLAPGRHDVKVRGVVGAATFATGYTSIEYDHIRPQRLFRAASLALQAVDIKVPPRTNVAYVQGVGDAGASVLRQLDIPVTLLDPATLATADLSRYTTIVVGPRAYESSPALTAQNPRLLGFAKGGGTVVVQYGQFEMQRPGMLPYAITLERPARRVTLEEAPVTILAPQHPVLTGPNRIGAADFDGWVQERGLYMPSSFAPEWTPLLEMGDPTEPANRGALLVGAYGKGTWVYVTLSLFRQLPAGVPGAARLLANLIAAGQKGATAP